MATKPENWKDQRHKVEGRYSINMRHDKFGLLKGCVVTKFGIVQVWQYGLTNGSEGYGGMVYVVEGVSWFRQWRETVLTEKQLATEANKFAKEKFESRDQNDNPPA